MQDNQEAKCLLCGEVAELKHRKYPGYQKGTIFSIYYCKSCETSFSMPRIETSQLYQVIYQNGPDVPAYDRYWRYYHKIKSKSKPLHYLANSEAMYWGVYEALKQTVQNKQSERILEIGSGLGYLTYALRKENYNAYGLEISQEAVDRSIEQFGNFYLCQNLFDLASTNNEPYDVVLLSEVIEHVEDPIAFAEAIMKLLKPNGYAIITTPNKSFFPKDLVWETDLPPVHCWWFSEDSMKYMAKRLNATIHFINFEKFYKKHYKLHNMQKSRERNLPNPLFDQDWNLLSKSKKPPYVKQVYQSILFSIPFVKSFYLRLKTRNPNMVLCADRGLNLCAVYQKKAL